jgi:cupin superfamily acireductone dioxygenase involved in methionine salvage
MEAKQLQQYFNELAEKMMKGEITTDQACSLFKEWTNAGYSEEMEMLEVCLDASEKELAELKEESEEQIEAIAELEEERHTLFEQKEYLNGELLCVSALNERLKKENAELKERLKHHVDWRERAKMEEEEENENE